MTRKAGHVPAPLCSAYASATEARADGQRGELIDSVAAGTPVRKLLLIEALGHARVPFLGYRPDHRAGVELAAIDAHRAAEAEADLERRLDDGDAALAARLMEAEVPIRVLLGSPMTPGWQDIAVPSIHP